MASCSFSTKYSEIPDRVCVIVLRTELFIDGIAAVYIGWAQINYLSDQRKKQLEGTGNYCIV